jgi:type III pantothenate kinase
MATLIAVVVAEISGVCTIHLPLSAIYIHQQMNLVIDSGNQRAKVGIFNHENLIEKFTFHTQQELQRFVEGATFENLIISSVKDDARLIASWASQARRQYVLGPTLPLPVKSLYETPETLGMDRVAAVCGARQLFPDQHSLVIDAGTCVTYDFIDKSANYYGGSISPGLQMRFKAVHTFTAKLPLVSAKADVGLIGKSTESCIQSGVINGLLAEMEGIITRYKKDFPDLNVILCGGDAGFFENQMKARIFASPQLVLVGLNSILIHNVHQL